MTVWILIGAVAGYATSLFVAYRIGVKTKQGEIKEARSVNHKLMYVNSELRAEINIKRKENEINLKDISDADIDDKLQNGSI